MTAPVAYLGDAALPTVEVDCFGRSYIQDLTVAVRGYNWRFLYDPAKRSQRPAQLALFLNSAVRWYMCWYRYPAARRLFVLSESPVEPYFDQVRAIETAARLILTHDEGLLGRSRRYQRLDYGTSWINGGTPIQACRKEGLVSWFGSIQHPQSHGYAFRREVVEHLQRRGRIDCYGYGLHAVEDKREGLERYAFSVAMENTRQNWYFTEKLVDCFMCETVPIYWGCPSR